VGLCEIVRLRKFPLASAFLVPVTIEPATLSLVAADSVTESAICAAVLVPEASASKPTPLGDTGPTRVVEVGLGPGRAQRCVSGTVNFPRVPFRQREGVQRYRDAIRDVGTWRERPARKPTAR